MNAFDQMRQAIKEAEIQLLAADDVANQLAEMLRGRLRRVDRRFVLRRLKRELQDFNATTGEWKQ